MARNRKRRMMNQINVVPYIDVMLVLLVIFMVTSPMTNPGTVELPKVGSNLLKHNAAPTVITVKANNQLEIAGKAYEKDTLLSAVRQELDKTPEKAFVVAGDKNVKYEKVIEVLNLLKQANVEKVGLLLGPQN